MSDNVNKPSHYNAGDIETIDAIKSALGDAFLDYCRGNVLKYVWRCRHKGKLLEDLRKAAKYLEWAIEEAESEKPSKPQELAIPEGWRELHQGELLSVHDLYELNGEWTACKHDPLGDRYNSRIHKRHIRKIETPEPEPLAIPEGWRELEPRETPLASDMYEHEEMWMKRSGDANCEYGWYDVRHIRKIETENASETPNSSLPDPGEGYRLLSKDPPERVIEGDEYLDLDGEWIESENWRAGVVQCSAYYRRKIEPNEWIPKVGDKVRVARGFMNPVGEVGIIKEFCQLVNGNFSILTHEGRCTSGWFRKDDVELIEAAQ